MRRIAGALLCAGVTACGHGAGSVEDPIELLVTPQHTGLAAGRTQQYRASMRFAGGRTVDVGTAATWTSENEAIATVSATGNVTTHKAGATTISVRDPDAGITGTATLTVTAAVLDRVEVAPTSASVAAGTAQQYVATGIYSDATRKDFTTTVAWSSNTPAVATIDSSGRATGQTVGTATIQATDASTGVAGTATLTVTNALLVSLAITPTLPSNPLGTTRQFTATGTFSDASNQDLTSAVSWSSSQPGVATVSTTGLATSLAQGSTNITATHPGTGITDTTTLTVTPAVLTSLAVTPSTPSIALGTTQQFTATGTYSDGSNLNLTTGVTWASSNGAAATVSNAGGTEGRATSVAAGTTTISATHIGTGIADNTLLTVTPAVLVSIAVTPTTPSIPLGTSQQFAATGTYSDSSVQNLTTTVTWSSANASVATVSNAGGSEGLASSVAVGTATITATHPSTMIQGSQLLTVTSAVLTSISITPTTPTLALGTSQQFTATGNYSDATNQDLTTSVTWGSTNGSVATISNAGGSEGLLTTVAAGSTTVSANHVPSGLSDTTNATVQQIEFVAASSASEPSGVTTITFATPSGTTAGDVMLATVAVRPDGATITPPAGWTLVRRSDNSGGAANSLAAYVRVAGAGESPTHAFALSTSTGSAGGIVAFRNVDGTTPIDVHAGAATASGLSHDAPSVTTTVTHTVLVTSYGFSSSATWTSPPGMTEAFDVSSLPPPNAVGISTSTHYVRHSPIGATGTKTATASGDSDAGNTISIALRL